MKRVLVLVALLSFAVSCSPASASTASKPAAYIQNKGSDTIVNLALAWAERYQQEHSNIRISVTGGGSGTGIAALLNGTVDIANASRQISPDETKQAQAKGIKPEEFVIARDAIAVIVNPENPVSRLTLKQISDLYSGRINNWKELGGDNRPIVRHADELRSRGLSAKRSLALREFALGIEGLERFVRREPLRRVHECVFGVLALESEPVDPRL